MEDGLEWGKKGGEEIIKFLFVGELGKRWWRFEIGKWLWGWRKVNRFKFYLKGKVKRFGKWLEVRNEV